MKATIYCATKSEMTDYAKEFRAKDINNWYVRTMFECGHAQKQNRKSILLIRNERVIQKVICCGTCKKNELNVEPNSEKQ